MRSKSEMELQAFRFFVLQITERANRKPIICKVVEKKQRNTIIL